MTKYIAYLRVSTQQQGISGLGIEAQRAAVARSNGAVLAEYVEVESGKRNDRPQLKAALEHARKEKAVLLIAKLDRLARSVYFIADLMENSKVEFIACDMPQANRLTLQIMAVMAEHEARMISDRTKAALAAAKARGVKLGGDTEAAKAGRVAAAGRRNGPAKAKALELRGAGVTLVEIASRLERGGFTTGSGLAKWSPTQVRRLLA